MFTEYYVTQLHVSVRQYDTQLQEVSYESSVKYRVWGALVILWAKM
jgi:hypothetical protein